MGSMSEGRPSAVIADAGVDDRVWQSAVKMAFGNEGTRLSTNPYEVNAPVSLRAQAVFILVLIAFGGLAIFILLFRLMFDGDFPVILSLQIICSAIYGGIYWAGVLASKRSVSRRTGKAKLEPADSAGMLDDENTGTLLAPRRKFSFFEMLGSFDVCFGDGFKLDHTYNIFLQVVCASVLPILFDIIAAIVNGDADFHPLQFAGLLRLLPMLGFHAAFVELDRNLAVPHALPFMLRNLSILCLSTHLAACLFWLLARAYDFNEDTWVGAQIPTLETAEPGTQYLYSLYWAAVTASTVGYGDLSPVGEVEVALTICFVLSNIWLLANIVGGISALAALEDTDVAQHRKMIRQFDRLLREEHISEDIVVATREYLRLALHTVRANVDALPASVRGRIREERFSQCISASPLMQSLSPRFISALIGRVQEDAFVAGLRILRKNDMPNRMCIIIDGTASIQLSDGLDESLFGGSTHHGGHFAGETPAPVAKRQTDEKPAPKSPTKSATQSATKSSTKTATKPKVFGKPPPAHIDVETHKQGSEQSDVRTETVAHMRAGAVFGAESFICSLAQPWAVRARTLLRVISLDETDRRELQAAFPNDWHKLRLNLQENVKELRFAVEDLAESCSPLRRARDGSSRHGSSASGLTGGATGAPPDRTAADEVEISLPTQPALPEADAAVAPEDSPSKKRWKNAGNEVMAVHKFSRQLKLHKIFLQPREKMSMAAIAQFADIARNVEEEVGRDTARAYQELSAVVCHHAARGDDVELKRLLDLVPISNIPEDYDGRAGLHLAAAGGHEACVEALCRQGADVNITDRFGRTPLLEAVLNAKDNMIVLLRDKGARLNLTDHNIASRLCDAAMDGDLALIKRYLKAGANPNASDYDKRTCLMVAAAEGNYSICKALLERGADARIKDRWGHTALDEAVFHGHSGALEKLLSDAA